MEYVPCIMYSLYIFYRNINRYYTYRYENKVKGSYYTFSKVTDLNFTKYNPDLFIVSAILDPGTNFTLLNYEHILQVPEKISEITDYDEVSGFRSYKSRNSIVKCHKKIPKNYIVRVYEYTFPNGIFFCPDAKIVAPREELYYYYRILLHKYVYDYIPVILLYVLIFLFKNLRSFQN